MASDAGNDAAGHSSEQEDTLDSMRSRSGRILVWF
jgi:hypothetical protein